MQIQLYSISAFQLYCIVSSCLDYKVKIPIRQCWDSTYLAPRYSSVDETFSQMLENKNTKKKMQENYLL